MRAADLKVDHVSMFLGYALAYIRWSPPLMPRRVGRSVPAHNNPKLYTSFHPSPRSIIPSNRRTVPAIVQAISLRATRFITHFLMFFFRIGQPHFMQCLAFLDI